MRHRFSANLGFLYREFALDEAVRHAAQDGFAAVECHWPYEMAASQLKKALEETGLPLLGLNTDKGERMGLCALPHLKEAARRSIEEAFAYGAEVGAACVHVMAGTLAEGADESEAEACFIENLSYASKLADSHQMTVLIEAINKHDAPHYAVRDNAHAAAMIEAVGHPRLKIMFDCYHVVRMGHDIMAEFERYQSLIGHVQFASTPSRGVPDEGTTDYQMIFDKMAMAGWRAPFGAEYRVEGETRQSLGWMSKISAS